MKNVKYYILNLSRHQIAILSMVTLQLEYIKMSISLLVIEFPLF